jgi:hypothetical protein
MEPERSAIPSACIVFPIVLKAVRQMKNVEHTYMDDEFKRAGDSTI